MKVTIEFLILVPTRTRCPIVMEVCSAMALKTIVNPGSITNGYFGGAISASKYA